MLDVYSFLVELYVLVDTFCQQQGIQHPRTGRRPNLSCAEVVTLCVLAQWSHFASERDFYRFAQRHLQPLFPRLPDRSQFNRAARQHQPLLQQVLSHLVDKLDAPQWSYEILDSTGVPVRNRQRRGGGWLPEYVAIGRCNRLGWYQGFALLLACNPKGEITGWGVGSANAKEQRLTDTFVAARAQQVPLRSAGSRAQGPYLADTGFEGKDSHQRWQQQHTQVICPPRKDYKKQWQRRRRWRHKRQRQIIETVFDCLLNRFRLAQERPHEMSGFWTRLTAKMVLHNFCIWLNRKCARPRLAFADLIAW
jgi:hypothetical protein